jgi:hypothetical protein
MPGVSSGFGSWPTARDEGKLGGSTGGDAD